MDEGRKREILQQEAQKRVKSDLLKALFDVTDLDEYIADAIARHETQQHE